MSIGFRVDLNEAAFRQMNAPGGIIEKAVQRAAGKVRDNGVRIIHAEGRVDTGALAQSVKTELVRSDTRGVYYRVAADQTYARYQHDGVPGPIYPRRAKVLRFTPKGGSVAIFRPQVSGFDGIYFLTRPLADLQPHDFIG